MAKLNIDYSFIYDDFGYEILKQNIKINKLIPYKYDIDPRLIRFLRDLVHYRINKIKPCIPLYMKYYIKKSDWNQIIYYITKYNIKLN